MCKNMKNRGQELRWEKDWSQEQLARRSGVSRKNIEHIENGTVNSPSVYTALKLAKALSVLVEDIFIL